MPRWETGGVFCCAGRFSSMAKQPQYTGPACPACDSRDVSLRAFAIRIKNVRAIGVIWSEPQESPDGAALLKRNGKMAYRWRCNTCGHKFTAPHDHAGRDSN